MDRIWSSDNWGPLPAVWWFVIGLVLIGALLGLANGALNRVYRPVDGLVQGVVGRMGSGKSLFIVQRVLLPFCHGLGKKGRVMSMSGRPMTRAVTNFRFNPGRDGIEVRYVAPDPANGVSVFGALIALAYELGAQEGPWYDATGVLHDGSEELPFEEVCEDCGGTGYADIHDPDAGCPEHMERTWRFYRPSEDIGGGRIAYVRQPILNALVVLDEMHLFANSSKVALGDEASWIISMARKLNAELWWCSQHEMKVHKRLRDESSSLWLAGKLSGVMALFVGSGWHVAREFHSPALVERARNSLGTSGAPRASDRRVYRFTKATKRFYNSFELLIPDAPIGANKRERSRPGGAGGSGPLLDEIDA
jgi:hypothetical protein